MHPEENYGLTNFYIQKDDGEMVKIDATVTEISVNPSYELQGIDWRRPSGSITGTFTHNIRTLSPKLAGHFKKVRALGYIYIDDISNLL